MTVPRTDGGLARLRALVEAARHRAVADGRPVLVSLAEPARAVPPLEALERLVTAATTDEALGAALGAGAAYWSRPSDGFALAAAGAAAGYSTSGPRRFDDLDAARAALEERALVEDPSGGRSGVGPVLIGGFAFEPEGPRTATWAGFPGALLVVPRIQVTVTGGECWITLTLRVDERGVPDAEPQQLARLRDVAIGRGTSAPRPAIAGDALEFTEAPPGAEWRALVREATTEIAAGRMDKVVLARAVHARGHGQLDAFGALRQLVADFPSTHVFGFWHGARAFIGATPERLVQLEGDVVRSSSLAGSIRRGADPDEDRALRETLLASAKDRSEHELVRRAIVDALEMVCDDVRAADTPSILTLPQVHHLHTPVTARLRPGATLLDVVERLHPTPAVGGAPRDAALAFLREREPLDRGWYAAPVGWLGRGRGEFAVALRSAVLAGNEATLFAGCGIVAASDPDDEYEESALKMRPMQAALATGGPKAAARPRHRARAAAGGDPAR